jgi:hypothetical protein
MRKFVLPAAAAALAFTMLDAAPAKAQVVVTYGYYSQGYSGGYSPYSYGGAPVVVGGVGAYPAYSGYPGYGPSYYGGAYVPYRGGVYSPYYGGGYPAYYYGGGYPGYPIGWRR